MGPKGNMFILAQTGKWLAILCSIKIAVRKRVSLLLHDTTSGARGISRGDPSYDLLGRVAFPVIFLRAYPDNKRAKIKPFDTRRDLTYWRLCG